MNKKQITIYECVWTGKNKKEIERLFNIIGFKDYFFEINSPQKQIFNLYADMYVEENSLITGAKELENIEIKEIK